VPLNPISVAIRGAMRRPGRQTLPSSSGVALTARRGTKSKIDLYAGLAPRRRTAWGAAPPRWPRVPRRPASCRSMPTSYQGLGRIGNWGLIAGVRNGDRLTWTSMTPAPRPLLAGGEPARRRPQATGLRGACPPPDRFLQRPPHCGGVWPSTFLRRACRLCRYLVHLRFRVSTRLKLRNPK